jgi:hypothetical protein
VEHGADAIVGFGSHVLPQLAVVKFSLCSVTEGNSKMDASSSQIRHRGEKKFRKSQKNVGEALSKNRQPRITPDAAEETWTETARQILPEQP